MFGSVNRNMYSVRYADVRIFDVRADTCGLSDDHTNSLLMFYLPNRAFNIFLHRKIVGNLNGVLWSAVGLRFQVILGGSVIAMV